MARCQHPECRSTTRKGRCFCKLHTGPRSAFGKTASQAEANAAATRIHSIFTPSRYQVEGS